MKLRSAYKIIFFIACLFLVTSVPLSAEKMTDRWRLIGFTKYRDALFADMTRLTFPTPVIAKLWVKIAPSKKSKYLQSVNEYLEKVNRSGRGFKATEVLCEFDCARHLIRFQSFVYFDKTGNIIHAADEPRPEWLLILPGNLWGSVEKEACAEKK